MAENLWLCVKGYSVVSVISQLLIAKAASPPLWWCPVVCILSQLVRDASGEIVTITSSPAAFSALNFMAATSATTAAVVL